MAQFGRIHDAIVVGVGVATNSMLITTIVSRGDLIISDVLNNMSTVVGARNINLFRVKPDCSTKSSFGGKHGMNPIYEELNSSVVTDKLFSGIGNWVSGKYKLDRQRFLGS